MRQEQVAEGGVGERGERGSRSNGSCKRTRGEEGTGWQTDGGRQRGGRVIIPPSGTAKRRTLPHKRARARASLQNDASENSELVLNNSYRVNYPAARARSTSPASFATPHIGTSILIINSDWTRTGRRIIAVAAAGGLHITSLNSV